MQEKFKTGLFFALSGNLLFLIFALVCALFYKTFSAGALHSRILEILAYLLELSGFAALIFAEYMIAKSVRMRSLMKIGFGGYIVFEGIMMILELNSFRFDFYEPYSLALAVVHSILSAAVCFSFLQLDPDSHRFEALVIICIGIIFGGMLGAIIGIRIYFGIFVNAVAFSALFFGIKYFLKNEFMEVDCHGDRARVAEYKSDFFE